MLVGITFGLFSFTMWMDEKPDLLIMGLTGERRLSRLRNDAGVRKWVVEEQRPQLPNDAPVS